MINQTGCCALLAGLGERLNDEVVVCCSSRKGDSACRQLAEFVAQVKDVMVTPDGPRGPAYELGQGVVFLAQQSGAAVVPVNLEYSSCWRLKSWDRFILPKPFSKVQVIFGCPPHVRLTKAESEFERERWRLQAAMMQRVERR